MSVAPGIDRAAALDGTGRREQIWTVSHRADPASRAIADRHYNRQKIGAAQFVPPGRCLVLRAETPTGSALWVTSWPFAEYVKHAWAGAWVCSAFRNEGAGEATDLIVQAVAATRARWPEVPPLGMVTFVDPRKVQPIMIRSHPTFGRTWIKARFSYAGTTAGGLLAFILPPERMPLPLAARGHASSQSVMFEEGGDMSMAAPRVACSALRGESRVGPRCVVAFVTSAVMSARRA